MQSVMTSQASRHGCQRDVVAVVECILERKVASVGTEKDEKDLFYAGSQMLSSPAMSSSFLNADSLYVFRFIDFLASSMPCKIPIPHRSGHPS